ncbi:Pleckstrin y domain-containing H member 2 [Homalodisca vitripennis]|nr:Pleckstrin y domain-containing H member 2 [Homalodisca vitripennis]
MFTELLVVIFRTFCLSVISKLTLSYLVFMRLPLVPQCDSERHHTLSDTEHTIMFIVTLVTITVREETGVSIDCEHRLPGQHQRNEEQCRVATRGVRRSYPGAAWRGALQPTLSSCNSVPLSKVIGLAEYRVTTMSSSCVPKFAFFLQFRINPTILGTICLHDFAKNSRLCRCGGVNGGAGGGGALWRLSYKDAREPDNYRFHGPPRPLVQADWTSGDNSPESKDKDQALSKLATQVEEQRQLRLQDAKQVEAKAARIKEWVTNKLRELEAQNQHLREQNHKCNQQLELLRRHMAQLSAGRNTPVDTRPSSLLRANSTGSTSVLPAVPGNPSLCHPLPPQPPTPPSLSHTLYTPTTHQSIVCVCDCLAGSP